MHTLTSFNVHTPIQGLSAFIASGSLLSCLYIARQVSSGFSQHPISFTGAPLNDADPNSFSVSMFFHICSRHISLVSKCSGTPLLCVTLMASTSVAPNPRNIMITISHIIYPSYQCLHAFSIIAMHVVKCKTIQNVLIARASLTFFCVIG